MNGTNLLKFEWYYYHHLDFVGDCAEQNSSWTHEVIVGFELEKQWAVAFGALALLLNAISASIFIYDECKKPFHFLPAMVARIERGRNSMPHHRPNSATPMNVNIDIQLHSTSNRRSTGRSSFTLSLIFLCVCECLLNFGLISDYLQEKLLSNRTSNNFIQHDVNHNPPSFSLRCAVFFRTLVGLLTDIGIICRNWCVCLITMARAEVVLWPMGQHFYQRFLRTRRRFSIVSACVFTVGSLFAYFKHADLIGKFCYDRASRKYGLWAQEYLFTEEQYNSFILAFMIIAQQVLVWVLIVIFTVAIIVGLKPWENRKRASSYASNASFHTVQNEAMHKRYCERMRATRVVLAIVVTFVLLESTTLVTAIRQKIHELDEEEFVLFSIANALVTVDSICNFLILCLTYKDFRNRLVNVFCPCLGITNATAVPSRRSTVSLRATTHRKIQLSQDEFLNASKSAVNK